MTALTYMSLKAAFPRQGAARRALLNIKYDMEMRFYKKKLDRLTFAIQDHYIKQLLSQFPA